MLIDCNDKNTPNKLTADVCIIGSGPAGLTLARTLIEQNKTVIFIERGGKIAEKPSERKVHFKADTYDGIHNGLAFGFGGTGALWGGLLLPMLDSELRELGQPWSSKSFIKELRDHSQMVEKWVGVSNTSYQSSLLELINHPAANLKWGSFTPLISKWIPFGLRNIGSSWFKQFQHSKKIKILLHIMPDKWNFTDNDKTTIENVICRSTNGHLITVTASSFVIAAGALESPLILEKMLGKQSTEQLMIGHYLHDHLSLRIAEISNYSRLNFERLFTSFFTGPTMRTLRLCLIDQENGFSGPINWSYCHFVIEAPENSGFAVARDILRGLQAKNYLSVFKSLYKVPIAMVDLIRMIWMRYIKQKLSISKGSKIYVNLDFVKVPLADNAITCDHIESSDAIALNWTITENLGECANLAFDKLQSFWAENNLIKVGGLKKVECPVDRQQAIENIYDIYHPAGTCAIGRVVDSDLRIIGLSNGFVIGSSVFPKLGRSNPTLTIMALSRRLGITLIKLMNDNNDLKKTGY